MFGLSPTPPGQEPAAEVGNRDHHFGRCHLCRSGLHFFAGQPRMACGELLGERQHPAAGKASHLQVGVSDGRGTRHHSEPLRHRRGHAAGSDHREARGARGGICRSAGDRPLVRGDWLCDQPQLREGELELRGEAPKRKSIVERNKFPNEQGGNRGQRWTIQSFQVTSIAVASSSSRVMALLVGSLIFKDSMTRLQALGAMVSILGAGIYGGLTLELVSRIFAGKRVLKGLLTLGVLVMLSMASGQMPCLQNVPGCSKRWLLFHFFVVSRSSLVQDMTSSAFSLGVFLSLGRFGMPFGLKPRRDQGEPYARRHAPVVFGLLDRGSGASAAWPRSGGLSKRANQK